MKKLNLLNLGKGLSRVEMKAISGSKAYGGGDFDGGDGLCESNCSSDSDCSCNPCNGYSVPGHQRCASVICASDSVRINRCSC